jgi:MFS family permease
MIRLGPRGLVAIVLAPFTVTYNVGVLPAVMPAIVHDFGTSVGVIQSVLVLFSLVTASFAPTAENLCRHFGRTRVFLASLAVYGLGMAATAVSPTMAALAASFVVLGGLGAATLVSTPWTIVDLVQGGRIDPRVAVALAMATSLGYSAGALAGGFLATRVGWRWSFLPALVVLLVVFVFGFALPKLRIRSEQPIDWVGGLLSFLGFGAILLGVSLGGEFGWWTPRREFAIGNVVLPPFAVSIVPTLIAAGAIAFGLFVFWQRLQANRGRASLMRVGLLKKPVFVLGTLTAMLHTVVATGVQFNLYQFLPVVVALNPFQTALAVIPYPVSVTVVTFLSKYLRLNDRIAPKNLVYVGLVLVGAGIVIVYGRVYVGIAPLQLLPGLIVMGVGSGLFLASIERLVFATASPDEKPESSAIYNPVQNLGNSLGRAILGTLLVFAASRAVVDGIVEHFGKTIPASERSDLIFQLQEMIQTMPRPDVVAEILARLPPSLQPVLYSIEREAATSGLRTALLVALILMALCFLLARTLPMIPSQGARRSHQA